MNKLLVGLGILGVVTLLPIYRGAGHSRHDGVNFWRLLHDSTHLTPDSPFGHPHLPYSEAEQLARDAYEEALRARGS